eukprot:m.323210 g.323210  ORF g.323210 m.323210 type:complete len:331 (+) comp27622_c0_seq4:1181-2173(+)
MGCSVGSEVKWSPRFDHCSVEQALALRHHHVGQHCTTPRRLPKDHHPRAVATKRRRVRLGPAQRGLLVHHPSVLGVGVFKPFDRQKPKWAQPIVCADHDHVVQRRKRAPVELGAAALSKPSTVNPEQNGQKAVVRVLRCAGVACRPRPPHIQGQAVFRAVVGWAQGKASLGRVGELPAVLRAGWAERLREHHVCCGEGEVDGGSPAEVTNGRLGVSDPEEFIHSIQRVADNDRAALGLHPSTPCCAALPMATLDMNAVRCHRRRGHHGHQREGERGELVCRHGETNTSLPGPRRFPPLLVGPPCSVRGCQTGRLDLDQLHRGLCRDFVTA